MTYVIPTVADFRARFPTFTTAIASDAVVQGALDEASLYVDDTWVSQQDFTIGRFLYAAHVLTLDGIGAGTEAQAALGGTLGVKRMRSGTFEIERFSNSEGGSSSNDILSLTSYGRRFLALLRNNSPSVLVV